MLVENLVNKKSYKNIFCMIYSIRANRNIMVKPNYYLITSSASFFIPCVFAFYQKKPIFATVSLLNTLVSINYWRRPHLYDLSYKLDIVLTKIFGVYYFIYGFYNMHNAVFRFIGFSNLWMMVSLYNTSCILYQQKSDYWHYFHMGFHICVTVNKMLTLL